jgi:hypothetical protein
MSMPTNTPPKMSPMQADRTILGHISSHGRASNKRPITLVTTTAPMIHGPERQRLGAPASYDSRVTSVCMCLIKSRVDVPAG